MRIILLNFVIVSASIGNVIAATTQIEKREVPQGSGTSYMSYRNGDSTQNSYGVISNAAERQGQFPAGITVAYGPAAPSNYGPPPQGGPTYPSYGYKDPGFSVQTGFEGYLVPNPWYSVIPWGIEGLVVVVLGIVVVIAVKAGILFLLFKFFKLGKLFKDEAEDESRSFSYLPSVFNQENISRISSNVWDAIDKYNDIIRIKLD